MKRAVILAAFLAGCTRPPATELIVFVDAQRTEETPDIAALRLRVWALGETGPVYDESFVVSESRDGGGNLDASLPTIGLPFRVPLVPRGGDASRRVLLEVTLFDRGGAVISEGRLVAGYVAQESREVTLCLEAACAGVECGAPEVCVTGLESACTSCREGRCIELADESMPFDPLRDPAARRCPPVSPCARIETSCSDGEDNDCDELFDCDDREDCLGQVCDRFGTICADESGGACGDRIDNDCDGSTDCGDVGCDGAECGPGQRCLLGSCEVCTPAAEHEDCATDADDDCDGEINCGDPDCDGAVCPGINNFCRGGACQCAEVAEREALCGNGVDDDCDGTTDCADSECDRAGCGGGLVCIDGGCAPCVPSGSVESCASSADDDCDGDLNCADADCGAGAPCAPLRVCSGGACVCADAEESGAECADGIDNDCDGLVDCADFDACCPSGACNGLHRYGVGWQFCCAARIVDIRNDRENCGGCGVSCGGGYNCRSDGDSGFCRCRSPDETYCPLGQYCRNDGAFPGGGSGDACSCSASSAHCPPGTYCAGVSGDGFIDVCRPI